MGPAHWGGSWRPGGTFEYPPALVVLQVSALPAFGWAMLRAQRRWVALFGAGAAAMAGAVAGTADSRAGLALCVAVAVGAVLAARSLGFDPRRVALAVAVPALAGVAAHLLLGGHAAPGARGATGQLAVTLAVLLGLVAAWGAASRALPAASISRAESAAHAPRAARLAVATGAAVLVVGALAFATDQAAPGVEPVSGFDHGRAAEWAVAADAAIERPLLGAGSDAYIAAAAGGGGGGTLYAHSLPLETWAELGPVGLALVLVLYGSAGALCWRLRRDPRAWLLIPAATAFLLVSLVDWSWHLAGSAAVWAVALGGLLALDADRRSVPTRTPPSRQRAPARG